MYIHEGNKGHLNARREMGEGGQEERGLERVKGRRKWSGLGGRHSGGKKGGIERGRDGGVGGRGRRRPKGVREKEG